jgi:hypothetical protein
MSFLLMGALLCGCSSTIPDDAYPQRIKTPKYPRISNVEVKDYEFDLSAVPIRTRVIYATPFMYDGRDTRFFRLQVLDTILRRDNQMVIPRGSILFGTQNRATGRYIKITRFQRADRKEWTPAYGIAEVAPLHGISLAYLSKVSTPVEKNR